MIWYYYANLTWRELSLADNDDRRSLTRSQAVTKTIVLGLSTSQWWHTGVRLSLVFSRIQSHLQSIQVTREGAFSTIYTCRLTPLTCKRLEIKKSRRSASKE